MGREMTEKDNMTIRKEESDWNGTKACFQEATKVQSNTVKKARSALQFNSLIVCIKLIQLSLSHGTMQIVYISSFLYGKHLFQIQSCKKKKQKTTF